MPRIAGVDIPENKKIKFSLTYVYGIGRTLAVRILEKVGIDPDLKTSEINSSQVNALSEILTKEYLTEGELRRSRINDIRRLKEIGCWRGSRHSKRLPVRGQRTKRNSRTVRGNKRVTVGSGRKTAPTPK